MKKFLIALFILILCISTALFAASCEKIKSPTGTTESQIGNKQSFIEFKTLSVDDLTVYGKVSNETTTFSFINEIRANRNCKYEVSLDIYGVQLVTSKTIALNVGDNVVYVIEFKNDEPINLYTVIIRRRPIYQVSFNTNGGSAVATQYVEEDCLATQPTTEKVGYDFVSWNYNFNEPITRDTIITAQFKVKSEMEKINFTFTETSCVVIGVKDKAITTITLPDYITSIGNYAFSHCTMLESVIFGDGITSIGDFAFSGCDSLTSIEIPNSVISIGSSAFSSCDRLTNVVIGDGVTNIGERAFYACENLTSIVIGESVTSINDYAFFSCPSLTSVYYKGTSESWQNISLGNITGNLMTATRYYYSETKPTASGNYWHYDQNGNPVAW